MRLTILLMFFLAVLGRGYAQSDSTSAWYNFHFQSTVINQTHPTFNAPYSGANSLSANDESHLSFSNTVFFGAKLWHNAEAYTDVEMSGGEGFSATHGIAGFTNGETYRVSDSHPHVYFARAYLRQIFPLTSEKVAVADGLTQVATQHPTSYVAVSAGKFSIMDFFDGNQFAHDPRSQFYNWALMGNGAWDYPANTRGYTYGAVVEFVKPTWAVRYGAVLMPVEANGAKLSLDLQNSIGQSLEYEKSYMLGAQAGKFRLLGFLNKASMVGYNDAISWGLTHNSTPSLDTLTAKGQTKYGFGANVEQNITPSIGFFARGSWNDGKNQTWAFTEIDRHASLGFNFNGSLWHCQGDVIGVAQVVNGISSAHKNYLASGGMGFMLGDGALNYHPEMITEIYYSFKLPKYRLYLAPDYQFVLNPGYNSNRGPLHAFGLRVHVEI